MLGLARSRGGRESLWIRAFSQALQRSNRIISAPSYPAGFCLGGCSQHIFLEPQQKKHAISVSAIRHTRLQLQDAKGLAAVTLFWRSAIERFIGWVLHPRDLLCFSLPEFLVTKGGTGTVCARVKEQDLSNESSQHHQSTAITHPGAYVAEHFVPSSYHLKSLMPHF